MIDVEYIRKLRYVKGWSVNQIAKRLGHSRNTIDKYLELENLEPKYQLQKPRARPTLGKYEGLIKHWLEEDKKRPEKQRHTAHRIYERLRDEYGFSGTEGTVRRYVAQVKEQKKEAFLPLEYQWGAEAECDFGAVEAIIGGRQLTLKMFCMKLMASLRSFVMLFPHEKSEAFYEGHRQAFEFFCGVPRKIKYDNPKVAVAQILSARKRIEQPGFIALRSHYLFESFFCLPGIKGSHEKGGVENLVGYARRNYCVPLPEVATLDELNGIVQQRCLAEGKRKFATGTLAERWAAEQPHLIALPTRPFDCCRTLLAKVNSLQLVNFERCRYSVPTQFVGQTVIVKAYVDRLEISAGTEIIARHTRLYEGNKESLQVEHYLEILARKPGAVANARIFSYLSPPYQTFRNLCLAKHPPTPKEFIGVLKLHQKYSQSVVSAALLEAIACNVIRADAVLQICQRLTEPQVPTPIVYPFNNGVVDALSTAVVDLSHFDQLLGGSTL